MSHFARAIRPDRPLYNSEVPRWWVPARQRTVTLTFPSIAEAEAWDERPTLEHLIEMEPDLCR